MTPVATDRESRVSESWGPQALNEMRMPHSLTPDLLEDKLEIPFVELNTMLDLNLDKKKINEFLAVYRKNYLQDPVNGTTIYEGVKEVLSY